MHRVCSRLDDQIYGATRIAPGLGTRLGLGRKLVNGVDRQYDTGDSRDTALIDRRDVVPEVVVVHAVNLPVHLVGTGSVERAKSADGISAVTWGHGDQLSKVPSVQ